MTTALTHSMKPNHIAVNVADSVAVTAWYYKHCGLRIIRQRAQPSQIHFLVDYSGSIVLEVYGISGNIPDYGKMNPWSFHSTLASHDPFSDSRRLVAAGAAFVSESCPDDGSHLVMLRDPWGLALLLSKSACLCPGPPSQNVTSDGGRSRLGRFSMEQPPGRKRAFAPNGVARRINP